MQGFMVSSILFRLERTEWWNDKPKLRTYKVFKTEYIISEAYYINLITCRAHCSLLAKLRGGSATLEIETGRYVRTPVEHRTCKLCYTDVENEMHFFNFIALL